MLVWHMGAVQVKDQAGCHNSHIWRPTEFGHNFGVYSTSLGAFNNLFALFILPQTELLAPVILPWEFLNPFSTLNIG